LNSIEGVEVREKERWRIKIDEKEERKRKSVEKWVSGDF
jgi:hypothetical protein